MSLQADLDRGRMAADVLNNAVYVDAWTQIDAELVTQWRNAKSPEEREHLHRMQSCLSRLQQVLQSTMDSGKVAAEKLQRERGLMSRLRSIG